jgi:hypothetical protein
LEAENGSGKRSFALMQNVKTSTVDLGFRPAAPETQRIYDELVHKSYSLVRYTSVIFFALISWLVYRRKQSFFVQHLVFGVHLFSFWYAVATLSSFNDRLVEFAVFLIPIYLALALRRMYRQTWIHTVSRAMILTFAVLLIESGLAIATVLFATRGWAEGK